MSVYFELRISQKLALSRREDCKRVEIERSRPCVAGQIGSLVICWDARLSDVCLLAGHRPFNQILLPIVF